MLAAHLFAGYVGVMFNKATADLKIVLLVLAFPVLALAWFFLAAGAFHLVTAALQVSSQNEGWLLAIWELAFSFGATSIATLIAAKGQFGAKPMIRKLFLYSQIAVSILFLGVLAIEMVSTLFRYGSAALEVR